jgi:Protein of unknown function (DUF2442)
MQVSYGGFESSSRRILRYYWRSGMSTSTPDPPFLATTVKFRLTEVALSVDLADGRQLSVSLEWFPRLRDATAEQRAHWRLVGRGLGIHWDELDEDISIAGLLRV